MGSISTPLAQSRLFKPLKVGAVNLKQRITFLPLTRLRSDDEHTPRPFMQKYYSDRASAPGTLIISEATSIAHAEEGQRNIPGFVSDAQVAAWRQIISGVHAKGSFFFQQIWALGRAAQPDYLAERGFSYRSPSAIAMPGVDATPQAMSEIEIQDTIQYFVDTAKRVIAAGGDGVEIHGAHGYLLDQFLSASANQRTDKWGGSLENRARLLLEVVKAVVAAVGAERVALRLSPYAAFQGVEKDNAKEAYTYVIDELKKMNAKLAYLSLVEARGDPAVLFMGRESTEQSLDFILESWNNLSPVIVAGGYTPDNAPAALDEHYKKWDVIIGFGRLFLANPDLIFRIKNGVGLNKPNRDTFYIKESEVGYNDYEFSKEYLKQQAAR
ncbi:hypothetical protein ACHAQA_008859 [Verticillium albo-atrum]